MGKTDRLDRFLKVKKLQYIKTKGTLKTR